MLASGTTVLGSGVDLQIPSYRQFQGSPINRQGWVDAGRGEAPGLFALRVLYRYEINETGTLLYSSVLDRLQYGSVHVSYAVQYDDTGRGDEYDQIGSKYITIV